MFGGQEDEDGKQFKNVSNKSAAALCSRYERSVAAFNPLDCSFKLPFTIAFSCELASPSRN